MSSPASRVEPAAIDSRPLPVADQSLPDLDRSACTAARAGRRAHRPRISILFGTRPEIIKLAPVIHAFKQRTECFELKVIASGQHRDLASPFVDLFQIEVDHDLGVMREGQSPNQLWARLLAAFDTLLAQETPDLLLVQGDTSTAAAGALAAFHQRVPVGHVEAGLRTGNPSSPFPEEMNRRLISRLATYHFAATQGNRDTLIREGVPANRVFVTGNPIVDALNSILQRCTPSPLVARLLDSTAATRRIVFTAHRREGLQTRLAENLEVMRRFIGSHDDLSLIFPMHPNPAVRIPATQILSGSPRILLIEPLDYLDFVALLREAWLVVSDSGGVQEEVPTLGKPLLILRENTERPEAVEAGIARLAGESPAAFAEMLEAAYVDEAWTKAGATVANPFGRGDAAEQIVQVVEDLLLVKVGRGGSP